MDVSKVCSNSSLQRSPAQNGCLLISIIQNPARHVFQDAATKMPTEEVAYTLLDVDRMRRPTHTHTQKTLTHTLISDHLSGPLSISMADCCGGTTAPSPPSSSQHRRRKRIPRRRTADIRYVLVHATCQPRSLCTCVHTLWIIGSVRQVHPHVRTSASACVHLYRRHIYIIVHAS